MRGLPLVIALTSLPLLASSSRAQLSPGPLSAPHHALEGATQCFQCHEQGAGVTDAKCLACHTEIAWTRSRARGYHERVRSTACAKCHPDHAGREFAMVHWDEGTPERFDHRRAGYALEGKHATLACRQCHQPRLQRSGAAPLIRKHEQGESWLGLETACASCHEDPHQAQLGDACARCHGQQAWKPASGFDHAKTGYPLTAKHAEVECAKCHLAAALDLPHDSRGRPAPRWTPVAHADCVNCHKDPHAGRFPGACAKCHTTRGFQIFDANVFDHSRTRYPLAGKHAAVACAKCHDPKTAWGQKPAFDRCDRCHADAHGGLGLVAGKPSDCAACHSVQGYLPATYTVASHQGAAFRLEGAHVRAACKACHTRGPQSAVATLGSSRVVMRPACAACTDCHLDPHRGRFAAGGMRPHAQGCRDCHTLDTFAPSTVDVGRHAALGFVLEGAHRAVPCQGCHSELKAPRAASSLRVAAVAAAAPPASAAARPLLFADTLSTCAGCHRGPHGDQFTARAGAPRAQRAGDACDRCHGVDAFAPASRFDHDRDSAFRLGGAHARVACAACHKSTRDAGGHAVVVYRPTPSRCEDCHVRKS
jgi:hypothetical protein